MAGTASLLRLSSTRFGFISGDLFGLTIEEMRYLLDPTDILGPDCGFETFGALQRSERHEFGDFRTRRMILEAWEHLPSSAASAATSPTSPIYKTPTPAVPLAC